MPRRSGRRRRLEQIERAADAGHAAVRQVEVVCRGFEVLVPKQFPDAENIDAGFQEVSGEGVAQGVNAAGFGDAGTRFGSAVDRIRGATVEGPLRIVSGRE